MNYDEMSKEELIEYIRKLEEKRAFSYEDQMKLKILDQAPFTVWASDRECRITFWEGQCERLYGISKKDAIGKDFVDLFVNKDEKIAARRDQIKIIDDGEVFHNIANDKGKDGNELHLVTNCWRIKDIESGEYWNAEMGMIIDFYEEEREILKQVVEESRKIRDCFAQLERIFITDKETMVSSISKVRTRYYECEKKAVTQGKRKEYTSRAKKILSEIDAIEGDLDKRISLANEQMSSYTFSKKGERKGGCDSIRISYQRDRDNIFSRLEGASLDLEEISCELESGGNVYVEKNKLLNLNSASRNSLADMISEAIKKVSGRIEQYEKCGGTEEASHMQKLKERKSKITEIHKEVEQYFDSINKRVAESYQEADLNGLEKEVRDRYKTLEKRIQEACDS